MDTITSNLCSYPAFYYILTSIIHLVFGVKSKSIQWLNQYFNKSENCLQGTPHYFALRGKAVRSAGFSIPLVIMSHIALYQKRRDGVIRGKGSGCSTKFFYCPKAKIEILTLCKLVCYILVRSRCMILRCPNPRFCECCTVGKLSEIFT